MARIVPELRAIGRAGAALVEAMARVLEAGRRVVVFPGGYDLRRGRGADFSLVRRARSRLGGRTELAT